MKTSTIAALNHAMTSRRPVAFAKTSLTARSFYSPTPAPPQPSTKLAGWPWPPIKPAHTR
jgi:hypothetical protein